MATAIAAQKQAQRYEYTAPKAIKFSLCDHGAKNYFVCSGRESVLFKNPNAGTADSWTMATSAASAGTFTLSLLLNGVLYGPTPGISFDAPAATIAAALLALISGDYPEATAVGSGTAVNSTGSIITFGGSIKGMPITLTHVDGGLTGGTLDTFTHTTTGAGAFTTTVVSSPDEEKRTKDWTFVLGALCEVRTQIFPQEGWADGSGHVTFDGGDNTILAAVLQEAV